MCQQLDHKALHTHIDVAIGPVFLYSPCSKAWVLCCSQNNSFRASGRATFLSLSSRASQCFWKVARRDQIHQPIKLSRAAVPQETVPPAAASGAANKGENQHQSAGEPFAPRQGSALQKSTFPLPVLLHTVILREKTTCTWLAWLK